MNFVRDLACVRRAARGAHAFRTTPTGAGRVTAAVVCDRDGVCSARYVQRGGSSTPEIFCHKWSRVDLPQSPMKSARFVKYLGNDHPQCRNHDLTSMCFKRINFRYSCNSYGTRFIKMDDNVTLESSSRTNPRENICKYAKPGCWGTCCASMRANNVTLSPALKDHEEQVAGAKRS